MSWSGSVRGLVSLLPQRWQSDIRRIRFRRKIKGGNFKSPEPEFELLSGFVEPGNWVIDIGANVGHYTKRLSELVGPKGRVLAFEPVPETFYLLSANLQFANCANVTLINAAVSDKSGVVGMDVPLYVDGLRNYYQAHMVEAEADTLAVLTLNIDMLQIPHPVSLVKIDAEGHELTVLRGMVNLLRRDHPLLIVECGTPATLGFLSELGYLYEQNAVSPNVVCRYHISQGGW